MDLLQENKKKNEKTPAQKMVLALLVISIVLCIIVGIMMAYVYIKGENKPFSILINGQSVNISDLQIKTNENGIKYISLRTLSSKLGYNYYNGEFKIADEGKSKGYIDNEKNIVQFFTNSKEIYKTTENSNTDYEYYNLENSIVEFEGNLYIALEDLDIALNLIVKHSEENNQTTIETPENWILERKESFEDKLNTIISSDPDNLRALSYGYVIINKDNKYGVISLENGEEIIGNKYSSITFCEYTGKFIASNTSNKFGIITKSGDADINLQYDSLEIINYNPLLYKVTRLERCGVIRENGNIINDIKYDSIGYPGNTAKEINYTLIIPKLNENIPESIVVCNENMYGLLSLESGKEILSCELNGIYSATEGETTYYIVETEYKKVFLENFIDDLNRVTVNLD